MGDFEFENWIRWVWKKILNVVGVILWVIFLWNFEWWSRFYGLVGFSGVDVLWLIIILSIRISWELFLRIWIVKLFYNLLVSYDFLVLVNKISSLVFFILE